jgi:hypothetical protein
VQETGGDTLRDFGMLERLGTVLYWIGCIIAGLIAVFAILIFFSEGFGRKTARSHRFLSCNSVRRMLADYALRYILAGSKKLGQAPERSFIASD